MCAPTTPPKKSVEIRDPPWFPFPKALPKPSISYFFPTASETHRRIRHAKRGECKLPVAM